MLVDKPALRILIPFIVGILSRAALGNFTINVITLFSILILFLLVIIIIYKGSKFCLLHYLPWLFLIFLGFAKHHFDSHYVDKYRIDRFIDRDDVFAVEGEILDPPFKKTRYLQFVIETKRIITYDSVFNVSGGVQIILPVENVKDIRSYKHGYGIKIYSGLSALNNARNPGGFDIKNYFQANDIYARIYLDNDEKILIDSQQRKSIITFFYNLRYQIGDIIEKEIGGTEATFLKSILIGDRSEIPYELKESFINSGVMHILAVSGLHVGIITIILLTVFRVFRLNNVFIFILTTICLVVYIFLTGSSPSVVRASIMAIVLLGALVLERKVNIFNSIAVAALIILLLDTRQLFNPGFQLSFVAVISIVMLFPIMSKIKNLLPDDLRKNRLLQNVIDLFIVSFSAAIGTLPFTSYYFGKISVIGLVANLIIVPLMGVVLSMGIMFIIFSFISVYLSNIVAESTRSFASLLLYCVNYFGNMKYSHLNSVFSISTGLFYYFWVFFFFTLNRKNFLGRLFIGLLLILNIYLFTSLFECSDLEILFFDVGQGDAILIKTPEEKYILVDAGVKNPNYDAARRFIVPYLNRNNIKTIDLLINSHPHSDHLGGIPTILRGFKVSRMIDAGSVENSSLYSEYRKLLDSLKINYVIKNRGDTIYINDKIRLYILNPTTEIKSTENINNHSIVIKIIYKNSSILLTGDIESRYEEEIGNLYKDFLKSNIYKCPHHGSNTSSSRYFIGFVKPEYAIISVGQNNKFDHPSVEVIERLEELNVDTYRTDHHGAVLFRTDGNRVWKIDWKK